MRKPFETHVRICEGGGQQSPARLDHAFQHEAGRLFRFGGGQRSDLTPVAGCFLPQIDADDASGANRNIVAIGPDRRRLGVWDGRVSETFRASEVALLMESGARICTVSSVAGLRGGGLMGTVAYATTKGAVLAMTKNVARTLGPRGIAVNAIAPGVIDTPSAAGPLSDPETRRRIEGLASFGRLGSPDEIAEGIIWLLSPAASFVNGATLVVDGGMVMY